MRGPLPGDCFAFLHADPRLPTSTERTEIIDVELRSDGLLSMTCSWGRQATGSARALARALDDSIYRLAASDEGPTAALNGSILRIGEVRCLLVTEFDGDLSDLAVALIRRGAAFEGIARIFLRVGGVVAHPAKPRLRHFRLAAVGLSHAHGELPTLHADADLNPNAAFCAIDPRMDGVEWSVMEGPVGVVLFVERNEGGRSAITSLRSETAFAHLLRNTRHPQRPDVRALIGLRTMSENAHAFRLTMGDPISAAALIATQIFHMRVDEPGEVRQEFLYEWETPHAVERCRETGAGCNPGASRPGGE
ncbi:hypothetical protein [Methylorubrum sp. SB2]|uniref:hypothetical protein n=1 Tax=Methylorubrum subtropicum TaxID=3138812 RepID=UPI00313DE727